MSMRRGALPIGLLLLLLSLMFAVGGCGGGSSSSSTSGSTEASSAPFPQTKKTRPIVNFGKEASAEELEAANLVVIASLTARENAEFAAQCKTLNKYGLEEIPNAKSQSACRAALKKIAEPLKVTEEIRKDRLSGSINEFRVKKDFGYALFHGNDGKDYALALKKEGGGWKVSAINTIELAPEESGGSSKPKASSPEPKASNSEPKATNGSP